MKQLDPGNLPGDKEIGRTASGILTFAALGAVSLASFSFSSLRAAASHTSPDRPAEQPLTQREPLLPIDPIFEMYRNESFRNLFPETQLTELPEKERVKADELVARGKALLARIAPETVSLLGGEVLQQLDSTVDILLTRDFERLSRDDRDSARTLVIDISLLGNLKERTSRKIIWIQTAESLNDARDLFGVSVLRGLSDENSLLYIARDHRSDAVAEAACDAISGGDKAIKKWIQQARQTIKTVSLTEKEGKAIALISRSIEEIKALRIQYDEQIKQIAVLKENLKKLEDERDELIAKMESSENTIRSLNGEIETLRRPGLITRREEGFDLVKVMARGGDRGSNFSWKLPEGARIIGIGGRGGERLDCFWVIYEENGVVRRSARWGGNGGSADKEILFDQDEYLTAVIKFGKKTIDHAIFRTNKGRSFWFGDGECGTMGPMVSTSDGEDGMRKHEGPMVIVGFHGKSDHEVRSLGLFVQYKTETSTRVESAGARVATLRRDSMKLRERFEAVGGRIDDISASLGVP